jgi:hypothetical protein
MFLRSNLILLYSLQLCCQRAERSGSILASRSIIFQKSSGVKHPGSICYIYIAIILKKTQKDKLAAEYIKTCIFVLVVDEYYIIMKLEMPSILHSISIYIYIYIAIILKKTQKDKLAAEYIKTCIFVLVVDEYYIIMKLEMPSILHSILMIISKL